MKTESSDTTTCDIETETNGQEIAVGDILTKDGQSWKVISVTAKCMATTSDGNKLQNSPDCCGVYAMEVYMVNNRDGEGWISGLKCRKCGRQWEYNKQKPIT